MSLGMSLGKLKSTLKAWITIALAHLSVSPYFAFKFYSNLIKFTLILYPPSCTLEQKFKFRTNLTSFLTGPEDPLPYPSFPLFKEAYSRAVSPIRKRQIHTKFDVLLHKSTLFFLFFILFSRIEKTSNSHKI